ncbi:MAG TPA: hypothetical protein VHT03_14455 [Rhizomicrobium sp.]|jgi:hypothetical protein|nr:hypothetical protein [Rhizomicrobium sp.]
MADNLLDLDKLRKEMQTALGAALDTWGNVEAQLCSIFCSAFDSKEYEIASAAFSAVLSFEVQTTIADAVLKEKFKSDKTVLNRWKPVLKKLKALRPIRNKLAHGKMVIVRNATTRRHEFRFLPFFHYYTHKDRKIFANLNILDIKAIHAEFGQLVQTLSAFGKSIGAIQNIRQNDWLV